MSPKNLQESLNERRQREFVGRADIIKVFRENLISKEERRFIINISGQCGVGKTNLLEYLRILSKKDAKATIAFLDGKRENGVLEVMYSIHRQLIKQNHPMKNFKTNFTKYQNLMQVLTEGSNIDIPKILESLTKIGIDLARSVPPIGTIVGEETRDKFSEGLREGAVYIIAKLPRETDRSLVQKPTEELTPYFLKDLFTISQKQLVALFFDNYERSGEYLDGWLCDCLGGIYGNMPFNLILAIAGRDELDWNQWITYETVLSRFSLREFSDSEVDEYMDRKGVTEKAIIKDRIKRLPAKLPLMIEILTSTNPSNDLSSVVVERALQWENDSEKKTIAVKAALPRYLNRDILADLIDSQSPKEIDDLFAWLKQQSFVGKQGVNGRNEGWVYDELIRNQMLHCQHQESPQIWTMLHGRLVSYYRACQKSLELKEEQQQYNDDWQNYELEALYHSLCQSPQKELSNIQSNVLAAFKTSLRYWHRWAETVRKAGEDSENPDVQKWGLSLADSVTAYEQGHYQNIISLFKNLAADSVSNQKALPYINEVVRLAPEEFCHWLERGYLYYSLGNYEQATYDFCQAIGMIDNNASWNTLAIFTESKPRDSYLFFLRGLYYQRRGRFSEAVMDLNEAFQQEPNNAWAIACQSPLLQYMGHLEEADKEYKRAYTIDPSINDSIDTISKVFANTLHGRAFYRKQENAFPT